jgi:polysaccharide deacetylase family protein (PEP-CTERM system associated)
MLNIISVDVEDYFHPTEIQSYIQIQDWETLAPRVEQGTRRTLELFARHNTRGTFFILGWVAQRYPALVREIAAAGHEIGCHSFWHRLVYDLSPEQFRQDTREAQDSIEAACGIRPRLYRAPSYSITSRSLWALDVLAELGFTHDSSIYPIPHDRYGIPGAARKAHLRQTASGSLLEVPIATVELRAGMYAPVGGGAYLRLLPYRYTAAGVRRLNNEGMPACLYLHPWELDAEQPRLAKGWIARRRTYGGLQTMEGKLERLLSEFRFSTLSEVHPAARMNPVS